MWSSAWTRYGSPVSSSAHCARRSFVPPTPSGKPQHNLQLHDSLSRNLPAASDRPADALEAGVGARGFSDLIRAMIEARCAAAKRVHAAVTLEHSRVFENFYDPLYRNARRGEPYPRPSCRAAPFQSSYSALFASFLRVPRRLVPCTSWRAERHRAHRFGSASCTGNSAMRRLRVRTPRPSWTSTRMPTATPESLTANARVSSPESRPKSRIASERFQSTTLTNSA